MPVSSLKEALGIASIRIQRKSLRAPVPLLRAEVQWNKDLNHFRES